MGIIPLDVVRVGPSGRGEEHLLVLRERAGRRLLPVTVGRFEAGAIRTALEGRRAVRPTAHDLLAAVILRLGGKLERVRIHDLRDETFVSQLELLGDVGLLEVDCRTSDAVALALRLRRPIVADEDLLARAAVMPRSSVQRSREDDTPPRQGGR